MNATKWLPFFFVTLVLVATFPIVAAQNRTVPVVGTNTIDREALLAIKYMMNDPRGLMSSWNESSADFCQWQGVICGLRHQRVIALNLSSGGLLGSLSPFIGNLSFLRAIRAQNNSLSGEIPPQVGRLFRLQELRLYNNSFTGNIPVEITNCSNLQVLHLGYNKLVGKIPERIGSLSMLRLLIVHENILQGGIPPFIGNLTLLDTLSFFNCRLGGTTPDVFQRLSKLRRFSMVGNDLVGNIPPSLYNLSSLEELYMDNNQLTGRLPTYINSTMPKLGTLSLLINQLTGPLPPSIFSSPTLRVIDVAQNNLSGKLVINYREVCQLERVSLSGNNFGSYEDDEMKFIDGLSICNKLDTLLLSHTQMRGFLPDSLGNLSTSLSQLDLSSNALSGSLPSSVSNLSGLTSLDVSSNRLTGTIPVTIGNLRNIRRLDFRNNSFSGSIPGSLGNLSLMIELHLSLNQLSGSIPSNLGNARRLLQLNLNRNNLTGSIPRELFELTSLSIILNLGGNQLSGELPTQIGNLQSLTEIILANNRLSGDLPSSLGSCSSLQDLNISNNFFSGSLPSLGSLRALENVDVSHNNFTGQIPTYLETIPLVNLNMSYNRFEGEVPKNGVFSNASSVSIVGNDGQLCGGAPELYLPECSSNKKRNGGLSLVVILVISIVPVLLCVALGLFLFMYCRRQKTEEEREPISRESLIQVSYETLYKATDGFSTKNLIGEGSFSFVYRGCLDTEDGVIVAIKVLNLNRRGGSKSFISECEALRNTRHRNLIKVITCCSGIDYKGKEFKAIVYEFMPNGNLDQILHNAQNELFRPSLLQRVCIALDVAYALDYLHHHAAKTIVHCDLKPSNILLDRDLVAHVGDFGLSKILQSEYQLRQHNSSVGVRGSIGYAAPEYGVGSKVSTSGDMYSYGILLLEMFTNKKPTDAMFVDGLSLHDYAKKAMVDGSLGVVDPTFFNNDGKLISQRTNMEETIGYMNKEDCLRLLLEIGVACSMESPRYRMGTASVIQELQLIKDAISRDSTVSMNLV